MRPLFHFGRSLSEEAASLIEEGLAKKIIEPEENWVDAMRRKVMAFGGVELEIPPRDSYQTREPPNFSSSEFGK